MKTFWFYGRYSDAMPFSRFALLSQKSQFTYRRFSIVWQQWFPRVKCLLLLCKAKPAWIKRSVHYVILQHYNPGELLKEIPPYLPSDRRCCILSGPPCMTRISVFVFGLLYWRSRHRNVVSWESEGPWCCSKMFRLRTRRALDRWTKSMSIAPFWLSTEHRSTEALTPFWLSAGDIIAYVVG